MVDQYGQLDVVANVAGILGNHTPFVEADLDNIHKVLDVNLMGTIIVDQKAGAQMVKQGSGVIVNVGSIDGLMANFESIGYMASKGGGRMATASVARELAPHGVRVVSVAPGWVETGMIPGNAKQYGATLHMKARIIQPEKSPGPFTWPPCQKRVPSTVRPSWPTMATPSLRAWTCQTSPHPFPVVS